jgi:hypothetical protein
MDGWARIRFARASKGHRNPRTGRITKDIEKEAQTDGY